MRKSKFSESQIVAILKEGEAGHLRLRHATICRRTGSLSLFCMVSVPVKTTPNSAEEFDVDAIFVMAVSAAIAGFFICGSMKPCWA